MPPDLLHLMSITATTGRGGYQVRSCASNPNCVMLGKLDSILELLWAWFPQSNRRGTPYTGIIFKVMSKCFVLRNSLFLHVLVLYSHFFLVLTPFSHSKTKHYHAGKDQSCYNHWPGHSIFGLINHNSWKWHKERQTLMPNFGIWKTGLIELFLLLKTFFLQGPWGVHWQPSRSGMISMPYSQLCFCIYVFLVGMFQNWFFSFIFPRLWKILGTWCPM